MMLKIPPNSVLAKCIQLILAVGYVALIRQLLALQASFFGETGSGLWLVSMMLVLVTLSLATLFLVNFALLRHTFTRLGLLASLAIFVYYYIYNPYGHNYILVYLSIIRSPPHLLNMLLVVAAPVVVGKFLQSRISNCANRA